MKLRLKIGTFVVALALCGTAGFSQNQNQNQNQNQDQNQNPIDPNAPLQPLDTNPMGGAYNKPPVGAARGVDAEGLGPFDPAQVVPDQNTLAGAAPYTLGSLQHTRNILDPAISLSQVGQVVPDANGTSVLVGQTLASASLNFNRIWGAYNFSALYNGGESFNIGYSAAPTFFGQSAPHYQFHTLILTQQANWARWHLLLRDNFMASPGAAFTGQGLGGPGLSAQFSSLLGNTLNSYSSEFEPAESVNTGSVLRFSNSILGQAEYSFTRRATITFAGSYGLLDFNTPGYFNSNLVNAQAGFDYLITPHDSLAILGGYGQITFNGTGISSTGTTPTTTVANGNAVVDYAGALAYGR